MLHNLQYNSLQCLVPAQQRTAVLIRTLHASPRALSISIVCIRWPVPLSQFVLQFHEDRRHSWIFMSAWNNLNPVLMDPLLTFSTCEHLLKTKLFVWTRTQLECEFVQLVLMSVFAISVNNSYTRRKIFYSLYFCILHRLFASSCKCVRIQGEP